MQGIKYIALPNGTTEDSFISTDFVAENKTYDEANNYAENLMYATDRKIMKKSSLISESELQKIRDEVNPYIPSTSTSWWLSNLDTSLPFKPALIYGDNLQPVNDTFSWVSHKISESYKDQCAIESSGSINRCTSNK
ncbi:MAG: hypothetical protein ACLT16_15675 [[Clostridium] innocuum]